MTVHLTADKKQLLRMVILPWGYLSSIKIDLRKWRTSHYSSWQNILFLAIIVYSHVNSGHKLSVLKIVEQVRTNKIRKITEWSSLWYGQCGPIQGSMTAKTKISTCVSLRLCTQRWGTTTAIRRSTQLQSYICKKRDTKLVHNDDFTGFRRWKLSEYIEMMD